MSLNNLIDIIIFFLAPEQKLIVRYKQILSLIFSQFIYIYSVDILYLNKMHPPKTFLAFDSKFLLVIPQNLTFVPLKTLIKRCVSKPSMCLFLSGFFLVGVGRYLLNLVFTVFSEPTTQCKQSKSPADNVELDHNFLIHSFNPYLQRI